LAPVSERGRRSPAPSCEPARRRLALVCADVRVHYGGIEVLHGVRLSLAYGTFSALVGPNGAGKTTLLAWCAGAASDASGSGRLALDGQNATAWPAARRAVAGLRYVPFERNVFPGLSVLDNLRACGATAALATFPELEALSARSAGVLSGGERQLVAVASALFGPGRTLLIDEPTHGLAPALAERVLSELARTAREDGRAVLVAEPQSDRVAEHADFLWPLDRGARLPAIGA
jgi:branched-chain amino acid transport system ATP-binding protein